MLRTLVQNSSATTPLPHPSLAMFRQSAVILLLPENVCTLSMHPCETANRAVPLAPLFSPPAPSSIAPLNADDYGGKKTQGTCFPDQGSAQASPTAGEAIIVGEFCRILEACVDFTGDAEASSTLGLLDYLLRKGTLNRVRRMYVAAGFDEAVIAAAAAVAAAEDNGIEIRAAEEKLEELKVQREDNVLLSWTSEWSRSVSVSSCRAPLNVCVVACFRVRISLQRPKKQILQWDRVIVAVLDITWWFTPIAHSTWLSKGGYVKVSYDLSKATAPVCLSWS